MKSLLVLLIILMNFQLVYADGKATVNVTLTPAGSFQAVSKKVKGNFTRNGDTISADKITVSIESFKTGIDLRDEHFWKHLQASKFPKATLSELKAKDGKATGNLEVNGVKRPVSITYKAVGDLVEAKFSIKASEFNLPKAEYLGVGVSDLVNVEVQVPKI